MVMFADLCKEEAIVNSLRTQIRKRGEFLLRSPSSIVRYSSKKALFQFITDADPFLALLNWVMTEMMRIEAEAKVGAAKRKHSKDRTTHFSSGRARRVDTRMGTVYLVVPKIHDESSGGIFPPGR